MDDNNKNTLSSIEFLKMSHQTNEERIKKYETIVEHVEKMHILYLENVRELFDNGDASNIFYQIYLELLKHVEGYRALIKDLMCANQEILTNITNIECDVVKLPIPLRLQKTSLEIKSNDNLLAYETKHFSEYAEKFGDSVSDITIDDSQDILNKYKNQE